MSSIVLKGSTSGDVTVQAPAVATGTVTMPSATGTLVASDSSGNVGIGVTPESWSTYYDALQVGYSTSIMGNTSSAGNATYIGDNFYYDGSWKYINTDEASVHKQVSGTHVFEVATSGTADTAISWTTAMSINNSGKVEIGSFSSSGASNGLELFSGNVAMISSRDSTGAKGHLYFYNPNGVVGSIQTSGSSTSYNTSSDYRLKENIIPMTGAIERINQLKPSRFNFISDPTITVDGFLAHEAQTVVPEAISGEKDAVDDEGNIDPQGIDQSKLVPLLVGAIQEQQQTIDALTARITALENA